MASVPAPSETLATPGLRSVLLDLRRTVVEQANAEIQSASLRAVGEKVRSLLKEDITARWKDDLLPSGMRPFLFERGTDLIERAQVGESLLILVTLTRMGSPCPHSDVLHRSKHPIYDGLRSLVDGTGDPSLPMVSQVVVLGWTWTHGRTDPISGRLLDIQLPDLFLGVPRAVDASGYLRSWRRGSGYLESALPIGPAARTRQPDLFG